FILAHFEKGLPVKLNLSKNDLFISTGFIIGKKQINFIINLPFLLHIEEKAVNFSTWGVFCTINTHNELLFFVIVG
ncbi:TPA: hypothetical protein ACK1JA_001874, partial [Providencia stuartii]